MKKIFYITSSQPDPMAIRKMETVLKSKEFIPNFIYWSRTNSLISKPFSTTVPKNNIYKITLPEPRGNIVKRGFYNVIFFLKAFKILLKEKPTILQANNMDMVILCALYKKFLRLRLVLDLLDTRQFFLNGIWKSLAKFGLKNTSLILVTSPEYETKYLSNFKKEIEYKKVFYLPNAPRKKEIVQLEQEKRVGLTIGYIGAFRGGIAIKGLVETVHKLRKKGYDLRVFFAGMGVESQLVEEYAAQLDFVDNFGNYDFIKDASMLYGNVDLIYSIYEQSFNKKIHLSCRFNDAVAFEKPVIVQTNTYQSKLAHKLGVGYSVEYEKWEQLEKLLMQLSDNPEKFKEVKENCKACKNDFLFETYEKEILESYSKLLK